MVRWEGPLGDWALPLFRRSCWAAAGINCAGLLVEGLQRGAVPQFMLWRIVVTSAMAGLPYVQHTTLRQRELLLVLSLILAQALSLASVPWAPAMFLMGALVVVGAGMSSVAAVLTVVTVQSALLLLGGFWLAPDARSLVELHLDSRQPTTWAVALVFTAAAGIAIVTVLRRIVFLTESAWQAATEALLATEWRVAQSRVAREARRRIEIEIQDDAKLYAVASLSRGLAHLLNNVLMTVRGALEELQENLALETRVGASRTIADGLQRVSLTLKALMLFSRRSTADARAVDIHDLVQSSVTQLKATLSSEVDIAVQGCRGLWAVVEPAKLQQMVVSLTLNGVEASRPGASMLVTVRPSEGPTKGLEILVEDTGHGMTEPILARLAEPFFTTRSELHHPGLGLTVVSGIVHEFGGTLHFESTPDVGTRASVWLPRVDAGETAESSELPLIHGGALVNAKAVESEHAPLVAVQVLPPPPWKERLTITISRWLAGLLCLLWTVGAVKHWAINLEVWSGALVAVVAAWVRMPNHVRLGLLLLSTWLMVITSSIHVAFPSPIVLVGLLLPVVWATLLGTPQVGWWALGGSILGLGFAAQVAMAELVIPPAAFDPRVAQTWFRIGVNGALVQLMLGVSVLSIVSGATRAIAAMGKAEQDLERAQADEELEALRRTELERERARSRKHSATARMIGVIVHDLASALQGLAMAELLVDPDLPEGEIQEEITNLWAVYRHCVALSAQFAVTEGRAVARVSQVIDIAAATARAVRTVSALVPERISVTTQVSSDVFGQLQESDLRRILFNLITNARDAIEAEGRIDIELVPDGEHFVLRVSDTGKGMDETTQAELFRAFFTTKPEGVGTGLGLYSVAQLVEQYGGTIWVQSSLGTGARFCSRFPRVSNHVVADPSSDQANELQQAGGRGYVLVIDDEPMVRRLLTRTLERAGYKTLEGADGTAALALVRTTPNCEALCIDCLMPGTPSGEVIAEFLRINPGLPVVVCSGMIADMVDHPGLPENSVHFLAKPFEPSQLVATLAAFRARTGKPTPSSSR